MPVVIRHISFIFFFPSILLTAYLSITSKKKGANISIFSIDKLTLVGHPCFFVKGEVVFPDKMRKTMVKPPSERNFEFIGNHHNDSILIGNYGDAKITAIGHFELSGLIYCRQSTVEINISGEGTARFNGICKKLVIQVVEGNCMLDLTNVSCQTVRCEVVKGKSVVLFGHIKFVELVTIEEEATVKYEGRPLLINHSLYKQAEIQTLRNIA
jgi:hypothetical protein